MTSKSGLSHFSYSDWADEPKRLNPSSKPILGICFSHAIAHSYISESWASVNDMAQPRRSSRSRSRSGQAAAALALAPVADSRLPAGGNSPAFSFMAMAPPPTIERSAQNTPSEVCKNFSDR
jgi:hypothetical protein